MLLRPFTNQLALLFTLGFFCTTLFAKPIPPQHQAFVEQVNQLITQANHQIQQDREYLLDSQQKKHLNYFDKKKLTRLAQQYRLNSFDSSNSQDWTELLKRVDTIPNSLALAQAINESAWGTSRFARQGHNLYGTWCYQKGCGIVPLHASSKQFFAVKAYSNFKASIDDYLLNLNSNKYYRSLRETRYQLHQHNKPISGYKLAGCLGNYSAIGQQYITAIQSLITTYQLNQLPPPTL